MLKTEKILQKQILKGDKILLKFIIKKLVFFWHQISKAGIAGSHMFFMCLNQSYKYCPIRNKYSNYFFLVGLFYIILTLTFMTFSYHAQLFIFSKNFNTPGNFLKSYLNFQYIQIERFKIEHVTLNIAQQKVFEAKANRQSLAFHLPNIQS